MATDLLRSAVWNEWCPRHHPREMPRKSGKSGDLQRALASGVGMCQELEDAGLLSHQW